MSAERRDRLEQERTLQAYRPSIINRELSEDFHPEPPLFGSKATVELEMTDRAKGLEIAGELDCWAAGRGEPPSSDSIGEPLQT
ncbi:MAG: hypothetical protein AAF609_10485 [Cyanobacteria bacterium P01_C01_bin.120]